MKVFGIVGWKNSGKTGLVERLVSEISGRGLTVSTVKHAHHAAEVDHESTDTFRHRTAGAREVVLVSSARWALMSELRGAPEPDLDEVLTRMSPADLILVEGYKRAGHRKIEAHRKVTLQPLLAPGDPTIVAVASDDPPSVAQEWQGPVLRLEDTGGLADLILNETGLA